MSRREQFNFRTSMLSDEAYNFLLELSETRQLTKQIAAWAEQEVRKKEQTPQIETSRIFHELQEIKSILQAGTFHQKESTNNKELNQEVLQLVSSDIVNSVIDDEDEEYDF